MNDNRLHDVLTTTALLAFTICFFALFGCKNNEVTPPSASLEKWYTYTVSNSPIWDDHVYSISVDYEGRVWFATRNGAIYHDQTFWGGVHDSLRTINYTQ